MTEALYLFGIFAILGLSTCSNTTFDDHVLIRLNPKTEDGFKAAVKFSDPTGKIEVFKSSRGVNDTLDLLVPPESRRSVQTFADKHDLHLEVKRDNYGRTLEFPDPLPKRRALRGFDIYQYNSYQAILEYMDQLTIHNLDFVSVEEVGQSFNKRPLKLMKISTKPNAGNPIIFIDAGIHSREWVAPAMAMYIITRLTSNKNAPELQGVDWYILPVVNPDGYEYTRTSRSNRLWRKTRSQYKGGCYGVDGNRNYGFKWALSGVSHDPCNLETYAGPRPFSESETQAVRNVMQANKQRLKLYVSLHSYGQYLVYPWGYTGDLLPKRWKKLHAMGQAVSSAVQRAGGEPFKVLSAGKWYPAAGASDDYAFGAVGVPYSFTMELTDGYDFIYPESQLRVVLPQYYEGFKVFGSRIKNDYAGHRSPRDASQQDYSQD